MSEKQVKSKGITLRFSPWVIEEIMQGYYLRAGKLVPLKHPRRAPRRKDGAA